MWRHTLEDGYQCFINYTMIEKEFLKESKDLKNLNFDLDKLVHENITPAIEKYLPKSFVYHEKYGYL